jgi:hypothetical protein
MNKLEKEKVAVAIKLLESSMKQHGLIIVTAEEIIHFLKTLDSGRKNDL